MIFKNLVKLYPQHSWNNNSFESRKNLHLGTVTDSTNKELKSKRQAFLTTKIQCLFFFFKNLNERSKQKKK